MPHANIRNRKPAVAAVLILLLGCLVLAACGGSSKTTSTSADAASTGTASSTSSSTTGTSTPGAPGAPGTGRFAALRECLQKNGITLPKRTPGSHPGGFAAGGGVGGGPQLPSGVTRAQYEAALKKCGGGSGHFFAGGGARRFDSPVFKAALAKYGECLRQNGIKVPPPNTSGNGPIFDTKGIDTSSSQFKAASAKCRSALTGAFRRPAGAPGPGGTPTAG